MRYSIRALLGLVCLVAIVIVGYRSVIPYPLEADVVRRIYTDFVREDRSEARKLLLSLPEMANFSRVHRSLVHLADGDLSRLRQETKFATVDYRDVIWRAEHDGEGNRILNFQRSFEEASKFSDEEATLGP